METMRRAKYRKKNKRERKGMSDKKDELNILSISAGATCIRRVSP